MRVTIWPSLDPHRADTFFSAPLAVFDGTIPAAIGDMESLVTFKASNNNRRNSDGLTGNLPESLGLLEELYEFDVSDNSIEGEIPASLGDCASLGILLLQQNVLEGNVPAELGNLGSIQTMNLQENDLEGEVPDGLCSDDAAQEIRVDCSVECTCCTEYDCRRRLDN